MWLFSHHMMAVQFCSLSLSLSLSLSDTYLPAYSLKIAEVFSFRKLVPPTHKAMQCHIPKALIHNSCSFVSKNSRFFLPFFTCPFFFVSFPFFLSLSLSHSVPFTLYIHHSLVQCCLQLFTRTNIRTM